MKQAGTSLTVLAHSPLFRGIEPETIEEIFSNITYQRRHYTVESQLALIGEECDRLLLLLHGEVRGEMTDKNGKTIKIEDIVAPSPLASAFIFGQQNRFPVTITANIDSEVVVIYKEQLLQLFQANKLLLSNFLTLISTRAQFLTQKIKFLTFGTIREKLAHYILMKVGSELRSFPMDKTQQQLADLFGVQRPSLARTLKELQDEAIIDIKSKTITVLDKPALKAMLAD